MSDIFICYSRKDSAIATKLRARLVAEGWSVFMDLHIDAGHRWSEEIEKELSAARAVLTLWSTNSVRSRFVMDEAHFAADRGIIFPARIEDIAIPYGFRQFQTPDLVSWNGDGDREEWQRMVATLQKHLNARTDERPSATKPKSKPKRSTRRATSKDSGVQPPVRGLPQASQSFRDQLKIGGEGPLMVVIPAGRFLMGSPPDEPERSDDEGPQHEVHIAKPFAMGVYAVTFDEYDRFCESTDRRKPGDNAWGRGNRPVIKVSWNDAQAYCAWLSHQTGRPYGLPSEAEWEYACRAGTTTQFYFGARITTEQANFDGRSTYNGSAEGEYRGKSMPVGSLPPNSFGLHDMHGNVWEWCQGVVPSDHAGAPLDWLDNAKLANGGQEHPEVKVVVSEGKEPRIGNIYRGIVTRIEPSLEAAFVDYGADRHGFLPFKEVSRSLFQGDVEVSRARIQDALKEGQEFIVQVEKDERGSKGAALTTFVSLAGRYLVLMPNNPRGGGVSRRVEGEERGELRDLVAQLDVPQGMSIIARTTGIGRTLEELNSDLKYLLKLWHGIANASRQAGAFLIHQESSIVTRTVRGGSWNHGPAKCRAAARVYRDLDDRSGDVGFRVCCASPIGAPRRF